MNQVTLFLRTEKDQDENVIENVIDISEKNLRRLLPGYSKKKLAKAVAIIKMISDNPQISIDDLRVALNVTDRTIARYIRTEGK